MQDAILVERLSKKFRRYSAARPWTIQEALVKGLRGLKREETFWALREVSFRIPPGRMVGVIGANGAGKSTLLRLVGGVGRADGGRVCVNGRIGALIDLGAGFHPDLTGRENVFINGIISGLTRREVAQQFDSIVDFSELEAFIDNPLRTYSTGMQMRLAFSIAVHVRPQILLVDEILAVGDISFQSKCLERIQLFKSQGCAILLVSHDPGLIERLCDEAIWLKKGQIAARGLADLVTHQYLADMECETQRRTPTGMPPRNLRSGAVLRARENRFGSLEMEIVDIRLLDRRGLEVEELDSGEPLQIEISYEAGERIASPIFVVTISKDDGFVCYDTNTETANLPISVVSGKGQVRLELERLDLQGGKYFVDVGIFKQDWAYAYDYHWHVYPFTVRPTSSERGILRPPHRWEVREMASIQELALTRTSTRPQGSG
jgi:lipopolysaccharide transport system ATP-binding protein